jgi:hypothetical protein
MLESSGLGLGALALAWMSGQETASAAPRGFDLSAKAPHFEPRATAVIQLVQNGGPSQMDLFDPKPELQRRNGQRYEDKVEILQPGSEANELMASPFQFAKYGESGMDFSELLPHTAGQADRLCMIRSMHTGHNNHAEGLTMLHTGKIFPGRPVMGSWISYGLGTDNRDLPAFVVLRDPRGYNTNGSLNWDNGWLPALSRGTEFSSEGDPVLDLAPSEAMAEGSQTRRLDLLAKLNEEHRARYPRELELESRIRNYELAARMQLTAGQALDISNESEATRKLYGLDDPVTAPYGKRCLLARRLVEQGVRFVQVFPSAVPSIQPWDHHKDLATGLPDICAQVDKPSAGLLIDLASRGLLDRTVVLWSGEFGRLPVSQRGTGRDHNKNAFSLWLAGGGFRPGTIHGATDEVGYRVAEDPVSVPDLHATILNRLGLDHQRLTYPHSGREETLSDFPLTGARVVREVLA